MQKLKCGEHRAASADVLRPAFQGFLQARSSLRLTGSLTLVGSSDDFGKQDSQARFDMAKQRPLEHTVGNVRTHRRVNGILFIER